MNQSFPLLGRHGNARRTIEMKKKAVSFISSRGGGRMRFDLPHSTRVDRDNVNK